MTAHRSVSMALAALSVACLVATGRAHPQQPQIPIPQPGVPQIMTLEAKFVRVAYHERDQVFGRESLAGTYLLGFDSVSGTPAAAINFFSKAAVS
jgi:hypothetical protein